MTHRPMTALAMGALLAGALTATAAPASAADACYPAQANCVAVDGIQIRPSVNLSAGTVTIVLSGLKPGSTVRITVVLPSSASGAALSDDAAPRIAPAVYRESAPVISTARLAATSTTVTGTADANGVATLTAPLSSFGTLTSAQAAALVFSVSGTAANGSPVSLETSLATTAAGTGAAASPATPRTTSGAAASSALPFTGSETGAIAAVGLGLVLAGGGTLLVARRRRDDDVRALGA